MKYLDFGGVKINRNSIIILFLLTLTLTLCISSAAAAATPTQNQTYKNSTTNTATNMAAGSTTTTTTATTKFIIAYYINPDQTPISTINFKALKNKGITDVYVRATTTGSSGMKYTGLPAVKKLTDDAGLKLHAWVWDGFPYITTIVSWGIGFHIDMETYNMASKISQIDKIRSLTKGKVPFSICVKPEGWDGDQEYHQLVTRCDYVVPMVYIGDYKKTISQLASYMQNLNAKYPGKFIAALETYKSDSNVVAKTSTAFNTEIIAVKPYVQGVALFRYGLSNFSGLTVTPISPISSKSFTPYQINYAATIVKRYVEKNKKLPSYVYINHKIVYMPQLLKLMTQNLVNINSGKLISVTPTKVYYPKSATETVTTGTLSKSNYIYVATIINWYTNKYGTAPYAVSTSKGRMNFQNQVYTYSKILNYYAIYARLPSTVSVKPWKIIIS